HGCFGARTALGSSRYVLGYRPAERAADEAFCAFVPRARPNRGGVSAAPPHPPPPTTRETPPLSRAPMGSLPSSAFDDEPLAAASHWHWRGQARPAFAHPTAHGQESVWDYPRPPRLEIDPREVVVRW